MTALATEIDLRDWALKTSSREQDTVDPGFIPLSWIPLSELRDHREFQRNMRRRRIERYRDRFDPRLFGAVIVARYPDGSLSHGPIDGMHRVETLAALYPGQDMLVPCFVVPVADAREEAQLFETLNLERVRIDNAELFRSRLFREDATALAMLETVRRAGWDLEPGVKNTPWNVLNRGNAALEIHQRSPAALFDTLKLLADLWPGQVEVKQESVVRGGYHFLTDYGKQRAWNRERVVQVLGDISLRTILRSVKVKSSGSRGMKGVATADTFALVYNENKDREWTRFRLIDREKEE